MRVAAWALVVSLVPSVPADAAPTRGTPVIACPSLANLRILFQRSADDVAAAAAILGNAKADHLGCILLNRDRVASVADRVAFGARDYECLAIQGTSVCHWTKAGAAMPAAPPPGPKAAPPAEKPRR